jgi:hypothetical protein
MRGFKIIFGVALLLVSIAITAACYVQSHGAGIGTGALLVIVITAYLYDHWRHIFGGETSRLKGGLTSTETAIINQGRIIAQRQDGEIRGLPSGH